MNTLICLKCGDEIHPMVPCEEAASWRESASPLNIVDTIRLHAREVAPTTNERFLYEAADEIESLRQQLAEANEAASESWNQAKALEQQLAEREREQGEINDALGILDNCMIVPLFKSLNEQLTSVTKERDAYAQACKDLERHCDKERKGLLKDRKHVRYLLQLAYAKLYNAKFSLKDPALMSAIEKYLQNTGD